MSTIFRPARPFLRRRRRFAYSYVAPGAGNTLTATGATFSLAGVDVGLSSRFTCEAASFAVAAQDAVLPTRLVAGVGSFTLSGQAALFAGSLVASAATFSLSGQVIGQAWPAAAAAFTLSGQAVTFRANLVLGAAGFTLNGQAANQAWPATAAAFTLAGQDVILRTAIGLIASGASFIVSAKPIWSTFAPDHPGEFAVAEGAVAEFPGEGEIAIATVGAAFALAGQAVNFRPTLSCALGAFTLTGNAANQSWAASAAAFTLAGQAALFVDRLAISAGSFVLAGQSIGQAWANGAASFAISGVNVNFTEARRAEAAAFTIGTVDVHFLDLEVASFALTGSDVPFSTVLAAGAGAFTLTGQAAEFLNVKLLEAEAGAFALSGKDIGFGRGVGIEAAAFALTPMTTPEVIRLLCDASSFAVTGKALAFNIAFHLATGAFVLRGVAVADVAGPSGDHTFLIEVQAHDGSDLQTFYLSKPVGFLSLPTDPTPNQFYDPRVLDAGNFKQVTGLPGENTVSTSAGNVVITNASPGDGTYLDDWLEMGFGGRSIVIRALPRGSKSLLSASVLLRARVDRLTSARPLEQLELTIRNKLSDLDRPLLTTRFAGTTTSTGNSAEGNADLKDQIKQQVWGEASQVLLQPANIYDLIYHASLVTAYSELVSITVSDAGVVLINDGDSASITALRAASISAGHYRTCLAEGLVRLGSSPTGAVTADIVEGTAAADRTAAQIVRRQLLQFGVDLSEISDGSFDDLDSKNDAVCYSVVDDDRSAGEEMQAILNSIGGRLLPNSNDLFAVTRFEAPVASPTLDFDIETDVIADTLQRLEGSPVVYQVALGWGRVHHPQAEGQLAGSVTTERKAYLAKDLRTATQTDNSVKTKHLDARVISFETRLAYQADAEAEAQRILDLMKVERAEYSVTLPLSQGWAAQVGGSIVLRHPRLGLADGKAFTVLERSDIYAEEAVGLDRVWG